MIDPLSPHAQVLTPGRTRPLLLRLLALVAALVLAGCSNDHQRRRLRALLTVGAACAMPGG